MWGMADVSYPPGRKRALEAQVREQLSFFPFLLQVSVARGDTAPAKHITNSEEQASIDSNMQVRVLLIDDQPD